MTVDLSDFLTKSATKPRLAECLWIIAEVRYATWGQIKAQEDVWVQHIATKTKISKLLELGFLVLNQEVYSVGEQGFTFLKEQGYNTAHLQKRLRADGSSHTLQITEILLSVRKESHFFTVFFPTFTELEPDACLVFKKEDAYKLEFLEVERTEKRDGYLIEKKRKYEDLAQRKETWEKWWRHNSKKLSLPFCKREDFCFSVRCYGKFRAEWEGWRFCQHPEKTI